MCVCVKPEFMYGHVCCKLRNSLGGYGSIRVVGVVAKSAVVTVGDVFRGVFMAVVCSILPPFWSVSWFADLHCLNSYPLDQVSSGKFLGGRFMIGWKRVFCEIELISCILARKPCAEPLAQRRILFIVSATAVRLTSSQMLPFSSHTCVFWMKSQIGRDLNPAI